MSKDRVMIDIETLGLERGAAIISIGAVFFDEDGLGKEYEASISLESCQDVGLEIDVGTLEWWLEQDDAAQAQLVGGKDIKHVLPEFGNFVRGADEVWANSPSFDCEMLEHAGEQIGCSMPWDFYEERDYRTLTNIPGAVADAVRDGTEHDALADAKHQARVARQTLENLQGAIVGENL